MKREFLEEYLQCKTRMMKIRKIASKIYKQNKIGKGEVSEKLGHHQLWSSLVCLQVQDIRETGLGRR